MRKNRVCTFTQSKLLRQYARDVTAVIETAQYYEREQHQAALMARLYEGKPRPAGGPAARRDTDPARLHRRRGAGAARRQHRAAVRAAATGPSALPIYAGTIIGRLPLSGPDDTAILCGISRTSASDNYQPDAQTDARLIGGEFAGHLDDKALDASLSGSRFVSFAGVPLLAQGNLLGVLCVHDCASAPVQRLRFRQVLELFAQQAAAIIARMHWCVQQERRRLRSICTTQ